MITELERIRAARAALAHLTTLAPACAEALHALTVYYGPADALDKLVSPKTSQELRDECAGAMTIKQLHTQIRTVDNATQASGARVLIPEDKNWPQRLDDLTQVTYCAASAAAMCLWVRGTDEPITARTVAVCGSRAATPYGTTIAADLTRDLAAAGWTTATTSGYGISAAAIRGALTTEARVVVVLAGGIDIPHPHNLRGLLTQVTGNHGLLATAYPPGTTPTRARATTATRLLAGMTSGTVLVEAAHASTSLAAIEEAVLLGRHAMVMPGPVTSATSTGAHQALRDHRAARLVTSGSDVLTELAHIR
ncbi:DNA-processing protein DprA [Actinoplanes sp. NPDC049802]|uniref:DNA-processing protein DprA n=1 Tax=Actinoplanes sp. NPDC049802 TaxID=3154742 RepID=UPI0033DBC93D